MSTACRLSLNRGKISTRRLRKVSPLTSRKKSTSTVSSSPLANERVPLSRKSRAELELLCVVLDREYRARAARDRGGRHHHDRLVLLRWDRGLESPPLHQGVGFFREFPTARFSLPVRRVAVEFQRKERLAITTALTLRAVFRLALRQTEGLMASLLRLLGLDLAAPDHSTLSRRGETLPVSRPRPGREPVHLLVDSIGLKLCGPGEWLVAKPAAKVRRSWRKLHIGVDADTGEIIAAKLTGKDVDDGSQVGPLLAQIAGPVAAV